MITASVHVPRMTTSPTMPVWTVSTQLYRIVYTVYCNHAFIRAVFAILQRKEVDVITVLVVSCLSALTNCNVTSIEQSSLGIHLPSLNLFCREFFLVSNIAVRSR